MKSATRQ